MNVFAAALLTLTHTLCNINMPNYEINLWYVICLFTYVRINRDTENSSAFECT